jgi:serine/threonine-protein kinase RsbW
MEKVIEFPSVKENIRSVEKLIDDISSEYKISDELYGNILIAAVEATNNAIIHGNKLDENKKVNIICTKDEDKLKFIIEDQGPGFDYEHVPDPTAPENLEKVNGRGIFLMRRLSDNVEFSNEGRKVELTFKL